MKNSVIPLIGKYFPEDSVSTNDTEVKNPLQKGFPINIKRKDSSRKNRIKTEKKRQTYPLEFKIEVIEDVKKSFNRTTALKYNIDEKLVRDWRKNETKIRSTLKNSCQKKKIIVEGGGRQF